MSLNKDKSVWINGWVSFVFDSEKWTCKWWPMRPIDNPNVFRIRIPIPRSEVKRMMAEGLIAIVEKPDPVPTAE